MSSSFLRRSRTWVQVSILALFSVWTASARAKDTAQMQFSSPKEAAQALFEAAKSDDQEKLMSIFGPDAKDILSSGDEVADKNSRNWFVKAYTEKHALLPRGKGTELLAVGANDFPFPIPIVNTGGKWRFDTTAGKEEILFRRIGHNELGAIKVCRTYVQAQHEYASAGRDGAPSGIYAQKLRSTPGKHDGLYWETKQGEPTSPMGPLVAFATTQGYAAKSGDKPFRGYLYRVLEAQGPAASGGAEKYVVDGQLKKGFALIAYPAEYRSSGVMTFIVNQDGVVYQKDLGERTGEIAAEIKEYNPDKSWTAVR